MRGKIRKLNFKPAKVRKIHCVDILDMSYYFGSWDEPEFEYEQFF